jgi:hypothetical protein
MAIHKILIWYGDIIPLMDVSFSAWRHSREMSLQLKGDSFSFLFDRRYTNRLNRMSRVFFEAYAVATKELALQEDRFPSLSEIDAKMESGAVYAFKDRLMKNTEFFEEVKISGVSYLVPRAPRFIDASGTYTDLVLNFEEGTVVLPTRRKTPAPPEASAEIPQAAGERKDAAGPETPETEPSAEVSSDSEGYNSEGVQPFAKGDEGKGGANQYPAHAPEPFQDIEVMEEPAPIAMPPSEPLPSVEKAQAPKSGGPAQKRWMTSRLALVIEALALLIVVGAIVLFAGLLPAGEPDLVKYSAYLSNSSNESYLGLDIDNPEGMTSEMQMSLPEDIDKSISARGGVVSISHTAWTIVRLNSSSDASVRIYLQGNWTVIPVTLDLAVPKGFDSTLLVHGKDYFVESKNDTLVLRFNLTQEGIRFDQSYSPKR